MNHTLPPLSLAQLVASDWFQGTRPPQTGSLPPHPDPTPVRVGIRTDDLLKLRGRSRGHQIAPARVIGEDDLGYIIRIFYKDCTVTATRRRANGPYHVADVRLTPFTEEPS